MYEALVKMLRSHNRDNLEYWLDEAADAIERLSRECKVLYAMLGTHPDPRGELGDPGILRELPKEGE